MLKIIALILMQVFLLFDFALYQSGEIFFYERDTTLVKTLSPEIKINHDFMKNSFNFLQEESTTGEENFSKQNIVDSRLKNIILKMFKFFKQAFSFKFFKIYFPVGFVLYKIYHWYKSGQLLSDDVEYFVIGAVSFSAMEIYEFFCGMVQRFKYNGLLQKLQKQQLEIEVLYDSPIQEEELIQAQDQISEGWHFKKHKVILERIEPFLKKQAIQPETINMLTTNIDRVLDNAVQSLSKSKKFPKDCVLKIRIKTFFDSFLSQKYLVVEIIDNGQGIESDKLNILFEKALRAGKSRKEYARSTLASYANALYQTGREIVKEYKGFIRIETSNNQGYFILQYLGLKPKVFNLTDTHKVDSIQRGTHFQMCIPIKNNEFVKQEILLKQGEGNLSPLVLTPAIVAACQHITFNKSMMDFERDDGLMGIVMLVPPVSKCQIHIKADQAILSAI